MHGLGHAIDPSNGRPSDFGGKRHGARDARDSSRRADAEQLNVVRSLFKLRDPDRVMRFLMGNTYMLSVLKELPSAVEAVFGPGTPVALRVACYGRPGVDDELEACVQTSLCPPESLARLHELDEAWLLERDNSVHGKLTVLHERV